MSKSKSCPLYVDGNGKYCCTAQRIRVSDDECLQITLVNAGPIDLLHFPTGDTDDASVVAATLVEGLNTVFTCGVFKLDFDCEALDGTEAPEDPAEQMLICYKAIDKGEGGAVNAGINTNILTAVQALCGKVEITNGELADLCAKILAGNLTTVELLTAVQALCDKLEADATVQTDILGELQNLCKKLETLIKIEQDSNACLQIIKANTAAITGIETSLGQIGCTEDIEGNITGSVLVCKHSDTTTDPATDTIKVWWFGLDGTVIEDYVGEYVACTNLQALANILENILAKLTSTPILWGVRVDENFVDNHSNGEFPLGLVAYRDDDHVITVNLSDGSSCNFDIAATASYPEWLDELAAQLTVCTGKAWTRKGRASDGDPNTPFGNYASVDCCPGDVTVVSATAVVTSETRNGRIIPLLSGIIKGEVKKYKQFSCLGQPDIWTDIDGAVVEKPDLTCGFVNCQFPAADPCGCPETVTCTYQTFPSCLIQNPEDEETGEPEVILQNVFERHEFCDGVTTVVSYTVDADGNEVPIKPEPDQYVGDCETLEPNNPKTPCPEDCKWEPANLVEHYATWENTNYVNPTVAAVKAGDTIKVTLKNGSVLPLITIVKNSLFEPKAIFEALGCTAKVHCDNWVINGEDRCAKFPAWPTGKDKCPEFANLVKADVYAAYLILTHCDPGMLPISTEIVESPREDVTGATHHSVCCSAEPQKVEVCRTCTGLIVKDCDNNIIEVNPKCIQPPKQEVCDTSLLDLLNSVKTIKTDGLTGADYTKALCYINGRPNANVSWEWFDNNEQPATTIIQGDDLESFIANVKAAGYTEFSVGERHYICPVPASYNGPGTHFFEADGETVNKGETVELATLEGAPTKVIADAVRCALQTIGCNDDRRDTLLQDTLTIAQEALDKQCLLDDFWMNCADDAVVETLDKEALTLTLKGDVGAQYTEGRTISLKDAAGNICGSATSTGKTSYNVETDLTTVTISECELADGKTPVQIVTAKPVLTATVQAVKNVVKAQVRTLTPIKEATPVRG